MLRQYCSTFATLWTTATRLLCSWDSPGKYARVGCHALLQGIFLTQGSNPGLLYLLHCRQIYHLSHLGSLSAYTKLTILKAQHNSKKVKVKPSCYEAQTACLLTRIPFISSCQFLWERDSYVTMTSNNTKYTGSLPFWKKQLYPYKLATPDKENIPRTSPSPPKNNQALPLGHLVTQSSYLKIAKLGTSQCLWDSPKCLNI